MTGFEAEKVVSLNKMQDILNNFSVEDKFYSSNHYRMIKKEEERGSLKIKEETFRNYKKLESIQIKLQNRFN